jgi:hypothetical protein
VSAIDWEGTIDGARLVVERGLAGDHRFLHGAQPGRDDAPGAHVPAIHHLSADASVLRCTLPDPVEPSGWRVVLDSVLFTVALLQGYEALHAAAIATPEGAIAISAATGGGKSTLLSELIARGCALLADDVLVLEPRGTAPPLAYPAPPVMTVPAARVPRLGGGEAPETIATVGDERWIAVPVHPQPLPLKALVMLDRRPNADRPGKRASMSRIESPLAPLLQSLMGFPHGQERQRTRFELASAIATTADLWQLTASLDATPGVLADTLLTGAL